MFLQSIANAVPEHCLTQRECWQLFKESETAKRLSNRSVSLVNKVLLGDNGIDKRHFALPDLGRLFEFDAETLNRAFEREAPKLARTALFDALEKAHLQSSDIDALIVCTCTGYICPGVSSHVAEQTNMRSNTFLQDIVGLGCGAAIPSLHSASNFLTAHSDSKVAVIAVEIRSAAFYLDNDPGVLISACIFADGASASIWSMNKETTGLHCNGFDLLHLPKDRNLLRFVNRYGKLRNILHKPIPEKAAKAVSTLFSDIDMAEIGQIISHAGGREVLEAIKTALPKFSFCESEAVLRNFGNMSSPSVLFALNQFFENNVMRKDLWLTSFGTGFACHSCRISKV